MDNIGEIRNTLFTIGYADLSTERFIHLLRRYMIQTIADVRSSPFSKHYPEFNLDRLKSTLHINGIRYVFLGKELGARRTEEECYVNGKVSYDLVFETKNFQAGVKRILNGVDKMRVALLCAEKDPLGCHRAMLICRYMRNSTVHMKHILSNGHLEDHYELEMRLLRLFNMELFRTKADILDDVYRRQAERIAFSKHDTMAKGWEEVND